MIMNLQQKCEPSKASPAGQPSQTSARENSVLQNRKRTINISLHRPEPLNIDTYSKFKERLKVVQENTRMKFFNAELEEESLSDALSIKQVQVQSQNKISSGISDFLKRSHNKIHFSRLARYLSDLKEIKDGVLGQVKGQQELFAKEKLRWSAQALALLQKVQESQERRQVSSQSRLSELQHQINIKDQQIIQLRQMLHTLQLPKLVNQPSKRQANQHFCSNCSLLEIKLNSIKSEAVQMGKKQLKLREECQHLQQKVFDLEQQVVGIELQVENRLKEALQSIPQLSLYNKTNQQIIDSVNRQNEMLRAKIQHYQTLIRSEQALILKEDQLSLVEREYQLRNQALFDAIARNQASTHLSYQREHQLLLAEQNLSKKIEQLRKKETELSQWENALTKNQHSAKNSPNQERPETFGRQDFLSHHEMQPSSRIFGNHLNSDQFASYGISQGEPIARNGIRYEGIQNEIYIPMLPIAEPQHYNQIPKNGHQHYKLTKVTQQKKLTQSKKNRPYQKSITESAFAHRSTYQHPMLKTSASNQQLQIASPQRLNSQNIQGSRTKTIGNRSLSKKSQSPARVANTPHYVSKNANYRGLQTKLDRLRSELRKEIESLE